MRPRKIMRPLLVSLLLCSTLTVGATITLFRVVSDNNNVRVTWEVANEAGVLGYDLHRKAVSDPAFNRLSSVSPSGRPRHQYLDTDLYRGLQASGPYVYRLTVRTATGAQYYTSTLGQAPSAVERSWGSIKSMFR